MSEIYEGRSATPSSSISGDPSRSFIEKNLKNMLEKSEKKRIAQEKYYASMNGRSPLVRNNKLPVHQRLGKRQSRFVNMPLGTSTSNVLPKNRYQQNYNRRRYTNFVSGGNISKTFSAQNRLTRIRQQQAVGFYSNNQLSSPSRPFRLRRYMPNESFNNSINYNDLTVQVANPIVKRFRIQLNPARQAEIRLMKEKNPHIIYDLSDRVQDVHATSVSLNYRFSNYR